MKNSRVISLCILFLAGCSSLNKSSDNWKKMTLTDLEFTYDVIKDSHPGPLDFENPDFKNWMKKGKGEAVKLAQNVNSYEGYEFAIKRYIEGFNDGHLGFWTSYERRKDKWPGFVMSYRSGKYLVYESKIPEIKKGDQLLSCDGKSIDLILSENIYKFRGLPEPASRIYRNVPHILVDKGNPFIALPQKCDFKRKAKVLNHKLEYTNILRKDLDEKMTNASFGPRGSFKQEYLGRGVYWFSIPTFGPSKSQQKEMYKFVSKLKSIKNKAKAVIFDVRGNSGGSSQWGDMLMESLQGKENVKSVGKHLHGKIKIDWRVSKRNLESVRTWPKLFSEKFGKDSETTIWATKFLARFEEAYKDNTALILQDADKKEETFDLRISKIHLKGRIYFLTDGRCGSACLDFADLVLSFPTSIHVGLETSADTVYMEGNILKHLQN